MSLGRDIHPNPPEPIMKTRIVCDTKTHSYVFQIYKKLGKTLFVRLSTLEKRSLLIDVTIARTEDALTHLRNLIVALKSNHRLVTEDPVEVEEREILNDGLVKRG